MEPVHSEEINIKDIINKVKEYLLEIKRCWLILAILMLILVPYFAYNALTDKSKYEAELTFMVNEDDGGGGLASGLSGIIGGLGFGKSKAANLDKILSLLKSKKITDKTLLQNAHINGSNDLLGNHFINYLDSIDQWMNLKWYQKFYQEESELKSFRLSKAIASEDSIKHNQVLNMLNSRLMGNQSGGGLISSEYGDLDFIMSISMSCEEEELSKELVISLFEKLSNYYVEKTTEKSRFSYNLIKTKTDSIEKALSSAQYNLANILDTQKGLFQSRDKLPAERLKFKIRALTQMQVEAITRLELADMSLKSETPFIQVLDTPRLPLQASSKSLNKEIISAILLSLLLGIGFIVARKFFRSILE